MVSDNGKSLDNPDDAQDFVNMFEAKNAIESLRKSDFDADSAYGEVLDNSIQAGATVIKVKFDHQMANKTTAGNLLGIGFSDDGDGMGVDADGRDILSNCLRLGWSSRYNDRTGIGRFGVGMTLGAISMCKRVEVYTKTKESGWRYTYLDLDEIADGVVQGIPTPVLRKPGEPWLDILPEESGTLVVWLKHDNQPDTPERLAENFRKWAGRSYRKYIWDGLDIEIDGKTVPVIDPLYVNPQKTRFENDLPGKEYTPIQIPWPIPFEDRVPGGPTESIITIRQSLVHEGLRPIQGSGNLAAARERFIHENEGISILRNGREVFYGHLRYYGSQQYGFKFENIDRWWGCEISFDAALDKAFMVKNIKRGAEPASHQLRGTIFDAIKATMLTSREEVRKIWKEARLATGGEDEGGSSDPHQDTIDVIDDTPRTQHEIDKDKDPDVEIEKEKHADWVKEQQELEWAEWEARFKAHEFTIIEDDWKGPDFFDVHHLGGTSILKYNRTHPFTEEINEIISQVAGNEGQQLIARKLKIIIDLMVVSFARGHASYQPDQKVVMEDFMEDFSLNWGRFLSNYLKTYKKIVPQLDDYDEDFFPADGSGGVHQGVFQDSSPIIDVLPQSDDIK